MTTTTPKKTAAKKTAPAATVEPFDAEAEMAKIPNRFWLTARRKLDMTADEILDDSVALSIVVAVRRSIKETGVPDWDRWLDASPEETADYIGADLEADDSKSS